MSEAPAEAPADEDITDPRRWKKNGWLARVQRNEDGDGWAVEMTRQGDPEPALVGPWTMGRDKVNPKPLDHFAFSTLVKTASEVLRRHEQALRAKLHRTLSIAGDQGERWRVDLDIAQDEDDPHAILAAFDEATDAPLRSARVSPGFKLTAKAAEKFVRTGEA
jgi:hypothetical protein